MSPGRFCLLLTAVVFAGGCASGVKAPPDRAIQTPSQPQLTTTSFDQASAAERKLERLAAQEIAGAGSSARRNRSLPAPPPGVEPLVLQPREASDPRAFKSLKDALAEVDQRFPLAPGEQLVPGQSVDPEDQNKALKLYAKARAAELDNNHLQAILDLQKAQALDPTSPEILRELARSYLAAGNTQQAVERFEKLLALDPNNAEALFTAGLAAANRRDFARAAASLGRLRLQGKSFAHDPAGDILADFTLAAALRELGYDHASVEAGIAAMNLPDRLSSPTEYSARLASVYRQRGETWRALGDAYCRLGEYDRALAAFAKSASLPTADPNALHARVIYANLCLGRVHSAQFEMLTVLKAAGSESISTTSSISDRDIHLCAYLNENAKPIDLLAETVSELYRRRPEQSSLVRAAAALLPPEKARALLKEFVDRRPRDLDAVSQLLAWLAPLDAASAAALTVGLAAEHADLADSYADRFSLAMIRPSAAQAALVAVNPSAARAQVQARLLLKSGGMGEAWSICTAARKQWPNDRGLMLQQLQLAAAMQESALLDESLAAMRPPNDVAWLLALSQVRRAVGQTQAAVDLARQAVALAPINVEAVIELARAEGAHAVMLSADPATQLNARPVIDDAVQHAEQARAMAPARQEPYEVLILIYGPGGVLADSDLFRQSAQKLREVIPHSPLFLRVAAQEAINARRYEQAVERLLSLYESDPTDTGALSLAVNTWQQWGKLEAAEQWVNQHRAQRRGDPALLEQWVRIQLLRKQPDAAIQRLEQIVKDDANDIRARRLLETAYRSASRTDSALELGEQRLLARPQGMRREVELAELYADGELAEKAISQLEWVRAHTADGGLDDLTAATAVAGRLHGDNARRDSLTLDLVQETIDRFPNASLLMVYGSGLLTLARQGVLDQRFDEMAGRAATQARGGNDSTKVGAAMWRELAQNLVDADQPAAAARVLRTRLRAEPRFEPNAYAALAKVTIIANAAASAAAANAAVASSEHAHGHSHVENDPSLPFAHDTAELVRTLEKDEVLGAVLGIKGSATLAEGFFEASTYFAIIGAYAGAESLLRQAVAMDPKYAMALNNLGYSRLDSGHRDEEISDLLTRAFALFPTDPNILDSIGWLRYKQGCFKDKLSEPPNETPVPGALTLIKASLEESAVPSAAVLEHLGDVHWRLGDIEAAAETWRQAVREFDRPGMQQDMIERNLLNMQLQDWQLVVVDPKTLYQREYGTLLERIRKKIDAVEQGTRPEVSPTFAEMPP